jgi:hypothetical protein
MSPPFVAVCGLEPRLERRAAERGVWAWQQGAGLVEVAVRVGRVAHALDPDAVTTPRDEQSGHLDEALLARTGHLRDRCV